MNVQEQDTPTPTHKALVGQTSDGRQYHAGELMDLGLASPSTVAMIEGAGLARRLLVPDADMARRMIVRADRESRKLEASHEADQAQLRAFTEEWEQNEKTITDLEPMVKEHHRLVARRDQIVQGIKRTRAAIAAAPQQLAPLKAHAEAGREMLKALGEVE